MTEHSPNDQFKASSFLQGHNAEYIEQLYARYASDPNAVDEAWQQFFRDLGDTGADAQAEAAGPSWARADWPPAPNDELTAALDGQWGDLGPAASKQAGDKIKAKAAEKGVEVSDDAIKRAVLDSAERAGARRVYLVEEPMAAGIGAQLPIVEATASMIVDIGGGTTEVAIMSLADIAQCESVRVAGDDLDEAIINHMKKAYNLMIGEQTAEKIKIQIGSAAPDGEESSMEVRGRDMISGLPRKTVITSEEIREALQEPLSAIIETVTRTLERCEPELAADLVDNGIVLAGGGALLRGIDVVISNATGLDSRIAEDPLTCVARGTAIYLEHLEEWKATMENDMDDS